MFVPQRFGPLHSCLHHHIIEVILAQHQNVINGHEGKSSSQQVVFYQGPIVLADSRASQKVAGRVVIDHCRGPGLPIRQVRVDVVRMVKTLEPTYKQI